MSLLLQTSANGSLKDSAREVGSTTNVTCVVVFSVQNLAFGYIQRIAIPKFAPKMKSINSNFAHVKGSCATKNCECKRCG